MRLLAHLALAAAGFLAASAASATVLTFDDIGEAGSVGALPANYGGLDWSAGDWRRSPISARSTS